ncbi:MAG: circadian clock KaiB family protein [Anaerolineae bacterium]|jgi:circadian clock protein KaiB|nr:circadian clock KaiB family protein [Anaerolineae bacterium]MDH7472608.1 circadian clock KaiB family protein [Anaerolineae bacterium]
MTAQRDKESDNPTCYHLRLFVAGDEPNSRQAKETLNRLCEAYLKDHYTLEIVDVLEDYRAALENQILVAPTLIIAAPPPPITIIGSLSDTRRVLNALGLPASEEGL